MTVASNLLKAKGAWLRLAMVVAGHNQVFLAAYDSGKKSTETESCKNW